MTTALKETGYFFCEACLEDKPLDDISSDSRYCQWCYDFLTKEATLVTGFVKPKWVPKEKPPDQIRVAKPQKINKGRGSAQKAHPVPLSAISKGDIIHNKGKIPTIPLSTPLLGIMSPVKDGKNEVDIIQPSVAKVTRRKRGPKFTGLPEVLIRQWAREGMVSKAIAIKLNRERGINVSYKTIQRLLSGQRVLV